MHPLSVVLGALLAFTTVLPASATESLAMSVENGPTEDAVRRRALERWNLLMEGRVESAYAYLSPGYREATSLARYSRTVQGVGLWKGAEVREVKCEEKRCEVKVVLDLAVGGAKPVPAPVIESWIQLEDGGDWWHVPTY
jgi:hypothetical protein